MSLIDAVKRAIAESASKGPYRRQSLSVPADPPKQGILREAYHGFRRIPANAAASFEEIGGWLTGTPALMDQASQRREQALQDYPTTVKGIQSYEDLKETLSDPGETARYMASTGPDVLASMAPSMLSGLGGAKAAQMLARYAPKAGMVRNLMAAGGGAKNVGSAVGAFAGSTALEGGSIAGDVMQDGEKLPGVLETLPWASFAGALESYTPSKLAQSMLRNNVSRNATKVGKDLIKAVTWDVFKDSMVESETEWLQTLTEEAAAKNLKGMPAWEAITSTIGDLDAQARGVGAGLSGFAGGAGGGAFSNRADIVRGLAGRGSDASVPADPLLPAVKPKVPAPTTTPPTPQAQTSGVPPVEAPPSSTLQIGYDEIPTEVPRPMLQTLAGGRVIPTGPREPLQLPEFQAGGTDMAELPPRPTAPPLEVAPPPRPVSNVDRVRQALGRPPMQHGPAPMLPPSSAMAELPSRPTMGPEVSMPPRPMSNVDRLKQALGRPQPQASQPQAPMTPPMLPPPQQAAPIQAAPIQAAPIQAPPAPVQPPIASPAPVPAPAPSPTPAPVPAPAKPPTPPAAIPRARMPEATVDEFLSDAINRARGRPSQWKLDEGKAVVAEPKGERFDDDPDKVWNEFVGDKPEEVGVDRRTGQTVYDLGDYEPGMNAHGYVVRTRDENGKEYLRKIDYKDIAFEDEDEQAKPIDLSAAVDRAQAKRSPNTKAPGTLADAVERVQKAQEPTKVPAPLAELRHNVTGAIERGEVEAIAEQKAPEPSQPQTAKEPAPEAQPSRAPARSREEAKAAIERGERIKVSPTRVVWIEERKYRNRDGSESTDYVVKERDDFFGGLVTTTGVVVPRGVKNRDAAGKLAAIDRAMKGWDAFADARQAADEKPLAKQEERGQIQEGGYAEKSGRAEAPDGGTRQGPADSDTDAGKPAAAPSVEAPGPVAPGKSPEGRPVAPRDEEAGTRTEPRGERGPGAPVDQRGDDARGADTRDDTGEVDRGPEGKIPRVPGETPETKVGKKQKETKDEADTGRSPVDVPVLGSKGPMVGGEPSSESARDGREKRDDRGPEKDDGTSRQPSDEARGEGRDDAGGGRDRDKKHGGTTSDTDKSGVVRGTEKTPGMDRDGALGGVTKSEKKKQPKTEADRNHVIQEGDTIFHSGAVSRAEANIKALELVKKLEKEDRNATKEEKKVLAAFSGWGALKNIFDTGIHGALLKYGKDLNELSNSDRNRVFYNHGTTQEKYDEWLKKWGRRLHPTFGGLLTKEEWTDATISTKNAHYTEAGVVRAMWEAIEQLGFHGGSVLEPSAGSGNFIGMMPADVSGKSSVFAVELDKMTGSILKYLYPEAEVRIDGFQNTKVKPNSLDLVVSNFPFANDIKPEEKGKPYSGWAVHNFFFGKSLEVAKPGGLVVAITSAGTMDARASRYIREYIDDKADFVGAIRLPAQAFEKSAGTSVVTDIIFLRKKKDGAPPLPRQSFAGSQTFADPNAQDKVPVHVNEYFIAHPEMIVGEMGIGSGQYNDNEMVVNYKGNVGAAIKERLKYLPQNITGADSNIDSGSIFRAAAMTGTVDGSIIETGGKFFQVFGGVPEAMEIPVRKKIAGKNRDRKDLTEDVRVYLGLRGAWLALTNAQRNQEGDEGLDALRKDLNKKYDALHSRLGPISWLKNHPMCECTMFPFLTSLETPTKKKIENGKFVVVPPGKEDIFRRRTDAPFKPPTRADSVEDAFTISLSMLGRPDLNYISKLANAAPEQARKTLLDSELVYEDPATGTLVEASEYLSGMVAKKYKEAVAAGEGYEKNAEALKARLPKPATKADVSPNIGVAWIDPDLYEEFIETTLGGDGTVERSETSEGEVWEVSKFSGSPNFGGYDAGKYFGDLMNGRATVVRDMDGKIDPKRTEQATAYQTAIKEAFKYWFSRTPSSDRILERFNDQVNGLAPRESYLPKHLEPALDAAKKARIGKELTNEEKALLEKIRFPGQSKDIVLDPHQIKAVFRAVRENTMLAHFPGAGKTFEFIAIAMEMKRLGLAKKPIIVAHNSTIAQYAASVLKLYPSAKVLVPSKEDREKSNRRRLLGKVNATDWDMVILPQSFFNRIAVSPELQEKSLRERIERLEISMGEAEGDKKKAGKKSKGAKGAAAKLQKLKDKLRAIREKPVEAMRFEELGADALLIDEAHAYKRSEFETTKTNAKGIDRGSSDRSANLMSVLSYIDGLQGGRPRNVVLATGTPISNTMVEAWTYFRYLRPDILKELGIESFDQFADTFMEQVTDFLPSDSGEYKPETRFMKYSNYKQFRALIRSLFDVVGENDVERKRMVKPRGGGPRMVKIHRSKMSEELIEYLRYQRFKWDGSGKEKMEKPSVPLEIQTLLRKASIDLRLINADAPADPDGKLATAAKILAKNYQDSKGFLGTQVVFCDFKQSPDKRFNLWDEMKRLLMSHGIPESEIASIYDHDKTDDTREALFDRVRAGEVRILMGSTDKVGVGVDVAERMVSAIHLDIPRRPMDFDQRNKRVIRQTNLNDEADVIALGLDQSFDARNYAMLEIKQSFIDQALRGDIDADMVIDEGEVIMSFAELSAILSGDPRAIEYAKLDKEIAKMRVHVETAQRAKQEMEETIKGGDENIRKAENLVEARKISAENARPLMSVADDSELVSMCKKMSIGWQPIPSENIMAELEKWRDQAQSALAGVEGAQRPGQINMELANGLNVAISWDQWEKTYAIKFHDYDSGDYSAEWQYNPRQYISTGVRSLANRFQSYVGYAENSLDKVKKEIEIAKRELERAGEPDTAGLQAMLDRHKELSTQIEKDTGFGAKGAPPTPSWLEGKPLFSFEQPDYEEKKQKKKDKREAKASEEAKGSRAGGVGGRGFQRQETPLDLARETATVFAKWSRAGFSRAFDLAGEMVAGGKSFVDYVARLLREGLGKARIFAAAMWKDAKAAFNKILPPGWERRSRLGGLTVKSIEDHKKAWNDAKAGRKFENGEAGAVAHQEGFKAGVETERKIAKQAIGFTATTARQEAQKEGTERVKRERARGAASIKELRRQIAAEKMLTKAIKDALLKLAGKLGKDIRSKFLNRIARATTTEAGLDILTSIEAERLKGRRKGALMTAKKALSALKFKTLRPEFQEYAKESMRKIQQARVADKGAARSDWHTLNAFELQDIADDLKAIKYLNDTATGVIMGDQIKSAVSVGRSIRRHIKTEWSISDTPTGKDEKGFFRWFFDEGSLSWGAITERLGKSGYDFFYTKLRDGERDARALYYSGKDKVSAAMEKAKKPRESFATAKWAGEEVAFEHKDGDGKMSRAHRMNLVANMLDESTRREILKAGIVLDQNENITYRFTEKQLDDIYNSLSEAEYSIVEEMRKFLNGELRDAVNKTWVKLSGSERAIRTDYWPRTRLREESGMNKWMKAYTKGPLLEGLGIFKERSGSRQPVVVGDVFKVFENHNTRASTFAGLAVPIRNVKVVLKEGGVEKATKNRFGVQFAKRVDDQLDALQDMGRPGGGELNKGLAKFLRNISTSALALNVGSWLRQFGGLATMATEFAGADALAGLKGVRPDKDLEKRIFKYSPVLRQRYDSSGARLVMPVFGAEQSFLSTAKTEAGDKVKRFQDWSMSYLEYFDQLIVQAIWRASESEIKSKQPGLSGDAFYEAVARRAEEVTARTQNTTSILDMSGIALESRKNAAFKVMTAFQSQGNALYNMVRRAFHQYWLGKISKAEVARRIVLGNLGNALITSAVGVIMAGGSDEPDEKERVPKVVADVLKDMSGMVYGGGMASGAINSVVRILNEKPTVGRSVRPLENIAESTVNNMLEAVGDSAKAWVHWGEKFKTGDRKGQDKGEAALTEAAWGAVESLAAVSGMPRFPLARLKRLG